MFEELTEYLDGYLDEGVPFYDCIVMKDGECVYRHMNGYTNPQKTIRVNGSELYNIYSCSKLITCTAALQLFEKGKFGLDNELYRYLPEFENMNIRTENGLREAKNKITIRHLFTMTAGCNYDLEKPMIKKCQTDTQNECSTRELIRYYAEEALDFEPGYRWEYSMCHDILAALVEVLSGMKFGEYVKENIFDVCNMNNSTFSLDDCNKLINQYEWDKENCCAVEGSKKNQFKLGTKYESGGAGCISTVDDYIKFLEAIRTYKLLKEETIDLLSTNQMSKEQMDMDTYWVVNKHGFGLGLHCPSEQNPRTDIGWGGAAGAHYFIDREKNVTAYMGTHLLYFDKFSAMNDKLTDVILNCLKN